MKSVTRLDPTIQSEDIKRIEQIITSQVIGQDESIKKIVQIIQTYNTGFNKKGSTISNILLLGGSGVGKTKTIQVLAKALLGDEKAILKIDCGEFQNNHDIAKIVGAPPGYTGHRDTAQLITQQKLEQFHTPKCKVSILLFDEIEKASDSMQKLLLGILDKATFRTSHNTDIDFSDTIVFMTSNLGSAEAKDLLNGKLGYVNTNTTGDVHSKLEKINIKAVEKHFLTELVGRIDHIINYRNLSRADARKILQLELHSIRRQIFASDSTYKFTFYWETAVEDLLLNEGYSEKYGARNLARSVKKFITDPLANLVASKQIYLGDVVKIIVHDGMTQFIRIPVSDIQDLQDDLTWQEYKDDLEQLTFDDIKS